MTEITKYVADDGTEFDDEWDCQHYEWEQGTKDSKYVLLNFKYEKLSNSEASSYDDCAFIFIPTAESAWDLLNNWDTDLINLDCPHFLPYRASDTVHTGLWAWDEDKERWFHLGEKLSELTKMAERAMSVINGGV